MPWNTFSIFGFRSLKNKGGKKERRGVSEDWCVYTGGCVFPVKPAQERDGECRYWLSHSRTLMTLLRRANTGRLSFPTAPRWCDPRLQSLLVETSLRWCLVCNTTLEADLFHLLHRKQKLGAIILRKGQSILLRLRHSSGERQVADDDLPSARLSPRTLIKHCTSCFHLIFLWQRSTIATNARVRHSHDYT